MNNPLISPTLSYLPSTTKNQGLSEKNGKQSSGGLSFGSILQEKIDDVNLMQKEADKLTSDFLVGKPVELHEVMLSVEKADLALQLTVQIRNKMVEAYKEISQMQI